VLLSRDALAPILFARAGIKLDVSIISRARARAYRCAFARLRAIHYTLSRVSADALVFAGINISHVGFRLFVITLLLGELGRDIINYASAYLFVCWINVFRNAITTESAFSLSISLFLSVLFLSRSR